MLDVVQHEEINFNPNHTLKKQRPARFAEGNKLISLVAAQYS